MDQRYSYGLRQRPTFKDGFQYLLDDPDTVDLPSRRALQVVGSFEHNQSKDYSQDRITEMELKIEEAEHKKGNDKMPYAPPIRANVATPMSDPAEAEGVRLNDIIGATIAAMQAGPAATPTVQLSDDTKEVFAQKQKQNETLVEDDDAEGRRRQQEHANKPLDLQYFGCWRCARCRYDLCGRQSSQ